MSTKRLSLNISSNSGPRPLHLVDRNLHDGYSPDPPSLNTKNTNVSRPHPVRRQSSISYYAADADALSPSEPRHAITRSVEYRSPQRAAFEAGDRKSTGSINGGVTEERQPLTLTEKHADLLQFIAQKESKCLELRSQLAINEAELLQLKRKWERIVNRGFDKANSQSDVANHTTNGQGSGAMLEGIKEGVQGVSRFIAAGLGEFSSPTSPSLSCRGHIPNQSNSSISTYTTKSTRFSQSSMSSRGGDPFSTSDSSSDEENQVQILMVHDTGATPTMSPNFKFAHQQQLEEKKARKDNAYSNSTPKTGADDTSGRRLHRGEVTSCETHPCLSKPELAPNSLSVDSASENGKQIKRANRELPPASSIPGLGSLTVGVVAPSWVDSVGRKWEELQKGSTFYRSQKRASVVLSDVSQTIVSVLSPPLASSHNLTTKPPSIVSPSLLDDVDTSSDSLATVMKPDSSATLSTSSSQDFDDEWNW